MTGEWDDPIAAVAGEWRGMRYDSLLELSWFKTLERYGFEWRPHPGSVVVDDVGTRWEPDALLGDNVLAEIKPWGGESVERLWKAAAAATRYGRPALVLRPGLVPQDPECETAGAVWESATGEEWVVEVRDSGCRFVRAEEADESAGVLSSAEVVMLDPGKVGMTMLHWSEEA